MSIVRGNPHARTVDTTLLVLTAGVALFVAPLAAATGTKGVLLLLGLAAVVVIAAKPHWGAYLYLLMTPLIVGIARNDSVPIRPNEALLGLFVVGVGARVVVLSLRGRAERMAIHRVELAILLMAVSASLIPLTLRYARGLPISADDLLYAAVLWKYCIVFRVFREAVRSPEQVAICLKLSLISAAVVGVVAVLQVRNLFGVPEFLSIYYDDPFSSDSGAGSDRGTSTIASSFGVADVMSMNLAVVLAMVAKGHSRSAPLLVVGCVLLFGCIASGQFSGLIGLIIVTGSVLWLGLHVRRLLIYIISGGIAGMLALWPVLAERLKGFETLGGLPTSWTGRLNNLQQVIWPELFTGWNWLLGVRPAARIPAPEPWREWIFIESGYTWLLWTGGLPLLLAFGFFVRCSLRELRAVMREAADPVSTVSVATFSWLIAMTMLMLLDPHLTIRGSADLFFPLLALSTTAPILAAAATTRGASEEAIAKSATT